MSEAPPTPPEFDLTLAEAAAWVGSGPEGIGEAPVVVPDPDQLEIEGDDPAVALRRTLGMFATGVTVITTRVGDQIHGMTANAFMSVSLEPPLVLISIDRRTRMCSLLHEGQRFAVSVLAADQSDALGPVRGQGRPTAPPSRASRSSTRRRWSRARRPSSSPRSVRPTGEETTRSSSAGSSMRATTRAPGHFCSTAAATAI